MKNAFSWLTRKIFPAPGNLVLDHRVHYGLLKFGGNTDLVIPGYTHNYYCLEDQFSSDGASQIPE